MYPLAIHSGQRVGEIDQPRLIVIPAFHKHYSVLPSVRVKEQVES